MPPAPDAVLSQVSLYAERLTAALADLETAGGLIGVGRVVSPKAAARVAERLRLARAEVAEALDAYDHPPKPARKPLLRRQANRPDPIPTVT